MRNVLGRLAIIALLLAAGVTVWHGQAGKKMQETPPHKKQDATTLSVQKPTESVPENKDYQIIRTRNIFQAGLNPGEKPSNEQPQTDLEKLAETKMQMVLLGTVAGSKEDARAIIRDETSKLEDIYQVGNELQGATITRIERGKVVLQVNGQEEVLNIKEPDNGGPQQSRSSVAKTPTPEMQTDQAGENRVPEAKPRRRISFRNAPSPTEPETIEAPPAPEPVTQEDSQPVPDEETPKPGSDENEVPGQNAK